MSQLLLRSGLGCLAIFKKLAPFFKPKPNTVNVWATEIYVRLDLIKLLRKLDII